MNLTFGPIEPTTALFVLVATAVGDILWTLYIRRTGEGHAVSAAVFTLLIAILGGIVVTEYVENSWYLVPAGVGAFIGTLITVQWDTKKKKIPDNK